MKKYPASIRCRESNPQPLEHESPPMTTRTGLPKHFYLESKILNRANRFKDKFLKK